MMSEYLVPLPGHFAKWPYGGFSKPLRSGLGYSLSMKLGKAFSIILLLAVTLSSVGFTTLAWYSSTSKKMDQAKSLNHSCVKEKQKPSNCKDENRSKEQAEFMKLQPDLSTAVKLQPNLDSPEMEGLVQLSEETTIPLKNWSHSQSSVRALPDRVAYEHVVLRI